MAIDVYLQIDGIKGESADSAHQGWIELSSVKVSSSLGALPHRQAVDTRLNAVNTERFRSANWPICPRQPSCSTVPWGRQFRRQSWSSCGQTATESPSGITKSSWRM